MISKTLWKINRIDIAMELKVNIEKFHSLNVNSNNYAYLEYAHSRTTSFLAHYFPPRALKEDTYMSVVYFLSLRFPRIFVLHFYPPLVTSRQYLGVNLSLIEPID